MFNRIRIPKAQYLFTFLVSALYLAVSWLVDLPLRNNEFFFPTYPSNLNFDCSTNWSFIVQSTGDQKYLYSYPNTCSFWEKYVNTNGNACEPFFKNYYCDVTDCINDDGNFCNTRGVSPYNAWSNCWCTVTVIMVGGFISFFLSHFIHELKARRATPFTCKQVYEYLGTE